MSIYYKKLENIKLGSEMVMVIAWFSWAQEKILGDRVETVNLEIRLREIFSIKNLPRFLKILTI